MAEIKALKPEHTTVAMALDAAMKQADDFSEVYMVCIRKEDRVPILFILGDMAGLCYAKVVLDDVVLKRLNGIPMGG
jgi:formyltetrahydrofolate synthetase